MIKKKLEPRSISLQCKNMKIEELKIFDAIIHPINDYSF